LVEADGNPAVLVGLVVPAVGMPVAEALVETASAALGLSMVQVAARVKRLTLFGSLDTEALLLSHTRLVSYDCSTLASAEAR